MIQEWIEEVRVGSDGGCRRVGCISGEEKRGEERRRLQGMRGMRRGGTRAVEVPRS